MEKIILTGEVNKLNKIVRSSLNESYSIEECDFGGTPLRRAIRMNSPRILLAIKSMTASVVLFGDIRDGFPDLGIVVVCEEKDYSMDQYNDPGVVVIHQPASLDDINDAIARAKSATTPKKPKRRVLAVDDDSVVLRGLKNLLEEDYDVTFATSGRKALELVERNNYDLIFLDYEMPVMNGYQVFLELKKIASAKDVPVVFLTGVSDKKRILEVVEHHPAGYLLKPINLKYLSMTLKDIFG